MNAKEIIFELSRPNFEKEIKVIENIRANVNKDEEDVKRYINELRTIYGEPFARKIERAVN